MNPSIQTAVADALPDRKTATAVRLCDLPPDALLRLPAVLAYAGISRTGWYRLMKDGKAPAPVRPSPRVSAWPVGAVREFVRAAAGLAA